MTTESSLQEDILETEDKSCVGEWKILSYSKPDRIEIAVDAGL